MRLSALFVLANIVQTKSSDNLSSPLTAQWDERKRKETVLMVVAWVGKWRVRHSKSG